MALAATGRDAASARMLEGMRAFASGAGTGAKIVGAVAVPVSQAVLAHRRGQHDRVVDLMLPVLSAMHALGGSHAQQDVLVQMAADSAAKAVRGAELEAFLAHAARGRKPPHERIGYTTLGGTRAH
jgi:hypothetical protein